MKLSKRTGQMLAVIASTLTRACREAIGRAPGEVVPERIMLEAMRAPTYTATSLTRISNDPGFADRACFARFFKVRPGMTASAFSQATRLAQGAHLAHQSL